MCRPPRRKTNCRTAWSFSNERGYRRSQCKINDSTILTISIDTTTTYVVDVRMDNGKSRSFPQSGANWRVGDQVRVVNGHLESRG